MIPEKWKEVSLNRLVERIIDYRGQSVPKAEEGIPLITARNVKDGYLDFSYQEYVPENHYESWMVRGIPRPGDVLFTTEAPLGNVCMFPEKGKYAVAQRTVTIRVNEKIFSQYLYHFLRSSIGRGRVSVRSSGSTAKGIKSSELNKVKVVFPERKGEQRKISEILSTWDKAITTSERLIEVSQQQRHALMQQLLTGKRRLPGFTVHPGWRREKYGNVPNDWEFIEIGGFSRQSSEKNREAEELPVLSCSKYDGFVDSLSYFNKRVYSEDLSGYKVIHRGDIGFPSNHVEEGSIGLQDLYDRGLLSPIYVVFRPDEERVDPEFLFRLLKTDHYRQVFAASTNASVDRRGSLRWKEFSAIKVPLPSLDEQKAIVLALKTADAEIEAQQRRLDCLRQEKKALMQQLLTGKRRVKVEATAPTEEAAC